MTVTFLHIGKTGGAAMRWALAPYANQFGLELAFHELTLPAVEAGRKVIFSVRDPISRFVSGFNSRLRQGLPRNDQPWTDAERSTFATFPTARSLAEALSAPDSALRTRAQQGMCDIYHTGRRLSYWLRSPAYLANRRNDLLWICAQPNLRADFEIIKHLVGLPADLRLPDDAVGAHRTPSGMDISLSLLAVDNLRKWYAQDIDLYAYCLELRHGLRAGQAEAA